MIDTIHRLIESYGLWAVFAGCLAEGESAAVLAGFFAHQSVFPLAGVFLATFGGAFLGDTAIFMAGRRFADRPKIRELTRRPGFSRALELVSRYPAAYVLLNRYVYGFRLVGGIAAGLSTIPVPLFLILNALSSAIWACLFIGVGYVFGTGAEQLLGGALENHHRLLFGLVIGVLVLAAATSLARHVARKARRG